MSPYWYKYIINSKEPNLCRISNHLCSCSALTEGIYNTPFLKCGLHIVTSFQRIQCGKGEKSKCTVQSPGKHCRSQVIKVSARNSKPSWWCAALIWHAKMALYVSGLPPQISNSSLIMRKTSDKSHLRDIVQNTWPVCLKTVKVSKKQVWETVTTKGANLGDIMTTTRCDVVSWMGSWDRKRT